MEKQNRNLRSNLEARFFLTQLMCCPEDYQFPKENAYTSILIVLFLILLLSNILKHVSINKKLGYVLDQVINLQIKRIKIKLKRKVKKYEKYR